MKGEREKPFENYDHLDAAFANACSQTECTGLISCAPLTEEEYESYMDIFDFGPPIVSTGEEDEKGNIAYGSVRTTDDLI